MLTEQAKLDLKIKEKRDGIQLCEDAIAKAEKYELLSDNEQWKGFLKDLEIVGKVHDSEIKMGTMMLVDAPHTGYVKVNTLGQSVFVSSKQDWMDFIVRHQIQKQEAENWVREPERILELARQARTQLPILREQLAHLTEGGNNAA